MNEVVCKKKVYDEMADQSFAENPKTKYYPWFIQLILSVIYSIDIIIKDVLNPERFGINILP